MPFTTAQLENIANSTLDFYANRPKVKAQDRQDRPLLAWLEGKEKSFPGGKEFIDIGVKGSSVGNLQGIVGDSTVTYRNPNETKRAKYPWKYLHDGIELTLHELLKNGVSVVDSAQSKQTVTHTEAEKIQLARLLEEKLDDFTEGYERAKNLMYWRDGTQDAALIPGITSFILDNPSAPGIVGGLDPATYSWWKNRAVLGIDSSDPDDQNLIVTLQREFRQLRRYGGRPDAIFCGSDFLEAFEKELRAKGVYTQTGFSRTIDASVADAVFKGIVFQYDPTLDDLGRSKFCYVLDSKTIMPMAIDGESDKQHNPARPATKYVLYRAMTYAGGLVCNQRNANAVYSIA